MKGRGAKMFERQKERMGKFTKDHKEEYKKYKGQQTRGAEGGHAQVRFKDYVILNYITLQKIVSKITSLRLRNIKFT